MPAQLSLTPLSSTAFGNTLIETYSHSAGSSFAKTGVYSVPNGTILQANVIVIATDTTNARNTQTWTLDFTWKTAADGSSSAVVGTLSVTNVQGTLPPDGSLTNPTLNASGSGFFINTPGLSSGVLNYIIKMTSSSF